MPYGNSIPPGRGVPAHGYDTWTFSHSTPTPLRWVGVQLTVAMDWYSRCITGLRLTPISTRAIGAAAVLYQSFRPVPAGRDSQQRPCGHPMGCPDLSLVEADALDPASVFAHPVVPRR